VRDGWAGPRRGVLTVESSLAHEREAPVSLSGTLGRGGTKTPRC
jgi:uncharacterized protein YdeI (BOF family)